jgi:hypothetical protein
VLLLVAMVSLDDIFIPLLKYIFNFIVVSGTFPYLWKLPAVTVVVKRCSNSVESNYSFVSILNSFCNIFEFNIYDRLRCFLSTDLIFLSMASLNIIPRQPVCLLVFNIAVLSVGIQGQTDSVYCDEAFSVVM